ncbi:nuclear transport factor 2 family protein [Streptomyces sp. NPDC048278]|uniref:nuclear transport factor 2 family protein n=1 Tax=unclassified Streptomyces TaxID=2593676 RepID=UPI003418D6C8
MSGDEQAREDVLAVERRRAKAMVEADAATLAELTADSYTHVESSGVARTKEEFLRGLATGEYRFESFVVDENRVRVYGDTAVVTGRYHNDIRTPEGLQPTKYALHTRVYVKAHGRWLNVAHQATEARPERGPSAGTGSKRD